MRKPFKVIVKEFFDALGTLLLILAMVTVGGMVLVAYSTIMVKTFQLVYKLDLIKFIQR